MGQVNDLLPVILVAFVLWQLGLSILFYWLFKHYTKLGKGVKAGNLIKVLDEVVQTEQTNTKQIEKLKEELARQDKEAENDIQNIGLIKFNPFKETGGDHSFALCMLDDHFDGFVLTCLHARDRTRLYIKDIKEGISKVELSTEEEKALKKAKK